MKSALVAVDELFRNRWFNAAVLAVTALLSIYVFVNIRRPSEVAVRDLQSMVQVLGLFSVSLTALMASQIGDTSAPWHRRLHVFTTRFVRGWAVYVMVVWTISAVGDDLYRWIAGNTQDALIAATAFAIVWATVRMGTPTRTPYLDLARQSALGVPAVAALLPLATARDNKYTAAHEAGHMLVHAALGGLPPEVRLAINHRPDEKGVLGFVASINSTHQLDEKTFAEWSMLVFLAGKMGEAKAMADSTLGSTNDHARWLALARTYLGNHFKGIYYTPPQDDGERQRNEAKLEALQAEQSELLERLFDANMEVFKELAATLLEKRSLGRDELIPFLRRVELPADFPRPFGPFDQFSSEWPLPIGEDAGPQRL